MNLVFAEDNIIDNESVRKSREDADLSYIMKDGEFDTNKSVEANILSVMNNLL